MSIMEIDLSIIGMERGRQYETIITTKNAQNVYNAAPIGVICSGPDVIVNRIFKGSHTLENIVETRKFTVNITYDPEIFYTSTLGNLPRNYFNEDLSLKCAEAYFKCEVISLTEAVKQSDPVKKKDEAIVIKSKVTDIVINKDTRAYNRGFGYVVESLSNLSRFDMVSDDKKAEYISKFREANRVVKKVGYREDIKAMGLIKKELRNKGYDL
ncbi:DUF447 domain-containing protein [Methanobrevibacter sp.]|uniref:DUF447 domain-containing protein n=1 Tax=Methanobrevibacter sp. TaxID=66852 RepID=UPI0025EE5A40|nr:DUF447 domain-containing protein [Methanobrevibacter sp.]